MARRLGLTTKRQLVAAALGLVLAACSSPEGSSAAPAGEPRTVLVRMTDELHFEPADISVAAGETVRFELTNDGQAVHEFLIGDEAAQAEFEAAMMSGEMDHPADAGVSVDRGQTGTFDYTFGDAGTEPLAGCHEPGHYDAGMVATITVGD